MTTHKKIGLSALQCPECGAPADVQQGMEVYHCHFCHAALLIEREIPEPPQREWKPPPPAQYHASQVAHHAPDLSAFHSEQAKRSTGRRVLGWVIFALVTVGGVVTILMLVATGAIGSWNGKKPLVCAGNERIYVDHVTAKYATGIAIDASGNCSVVCTSCQLSAPTVIRARENASVHLDHGSADGSVLFAEVGENASVTIDHTKTTGDKRAPETTVHNTPGKWPDSGPFVCGSSGSGTYDNVKVKVSSGAAIIGSINCTLKLSNCTIEGPVGLLLSDNASVELDHCDVRATDGVIANANGSVDIEGGTFIGKDHAAMLVDNANLHSHGTQINGSQSKVGNAVIEIQ